MAKVQYRITTVSLLDGKATTMVFSNVDTAFETYETILAQTGYHLFATFGRRTLNDSGIESFTPLHASISAAAGRAQARGSFARVRQMMLTGAI